MTLFEHLAELRNRLLKACLAIAIAMIVGWLLKDWLFEQLGEPLNKAIMAVAHQQKLDVALNFSGAAAPFMLMVQISFVFALVISSPVWLYQIWAFIVPGLHSNEKKWTLAFLGSAVPLFVAGVIIGYIALPKGLSVLFSFTPPDIGKLKAVNYLPAQDYMYLMLRIMLIFGVAFLIPVFVVLLNVVGVLSAARLAKWRAGIIFGIFVFAAVATPSIDPITMLLLALPMSVLYIVAEIVARFIERSRRRKLQELGEEDPDLVVTGEYDDD